MKQHNFIKILAVTAAIAYTPALSYDCLIHTSNITELDFCFMDTEFFE